MVLEGRGLLMGAAWMDQRKTNVPELLLLKFCQINLTQLDHSTKE